MTSCLVFATGYLILITSHQQCYYTRLNGFVIIKLAYLSLREVVVAIIFPKHIDFGGMYVVCWQKRVYSSTIENFHSNATFDTELENNLSFKIFFREIARKLSNFYLKLDFISCMFETFHSNFFPYIVHVNILE